MTIALIDLLKSKDITKSEYLFLEALLYEARRLTLTASGYFERYDTDFSEKGILALSTIRKVKKNLKNKGLIDFYKYPNGKKNIRYKVLLPSLI